jgi:hydroxymethylbilane synthase
VTVRIGTRGSALALAQAGLVGAALSRIGVATEIVVVRTQGDQHPDRPARLLGVGAFVAEIETALRDRRVDVAVHSAKDLPSPGSEDLDLAAFLAREDPADVLVTRGGSQLRDLTPGARIGTESPRRRAFILAARPDLVLAEMRGNVDTRLRKLDSGAVDGLVMAAAGLLRLGLGGRIAERFPADVMLPAVGQGAIVAQVRRGEVRLAEIARAIDDAPTRAAVEAERAFLSAMGGGCQRPISAWARVEGPRLIIDGAVADGAGRRIVRARLEAPTAQPERAGLALAERVRALGADALLAEAAS